MITMRLAYIADVLDSITTRSHLILSRTMYPHTHTPTHTRAAHTVTHTRVRARASPQGNYFDYKELTDKECVDMWLDMDYCTCMY